MTEPDAPTPAVRKLIDRRAFIRRAAAGTAVAAIGGGLYVMGSDDLTRAARAETRSDGRRRLPPGQRVLEQLKPMGGESGNPRPRAFTLKVHGEVGNPMSLDYQQLLALPQSELVADVHCVTGWSVIGHTWRGVLVSELARVAEVRDSARHVIFEGAHGYTANVPLAEATAANVMVTHRVNGRVLTRAHGAPVRALVPDLYFWKSAKWLTGVRFARRDAPGYWETRGYHNHADPWREERYG